MKTNEIAWLSIRSLGLLLVLISIKFGIGLAAGIYFIQPYREYSSLTVSSSVEIPAERDAGNPVNLRMQELYVHFFRMSFDNGVWFFLLLGSGLYLLIGGRAVHRILTRYPCEAHTSEQDSGGQPATRSDGNDPHDYNP